MSTDRLAWPLPVVDLELSNKTAFVVEPLGLALWPPVHFQGGAWVCRLSEAVSQPSQRSLH
jgi:hypothetical protein